MNVNISNRITDEEVLVIQNLADQHKRELGFLPASAYVDARLKKQLIVARLDGELVGYLFFGGRFPQCRVFQILVIPQFRSAQVGERLIGHLKNWCEKGGWSSIIAHVAADLNDSRRFYEKNGFSFFLRKAGGKTTGRQLDVLIYELSTPTLFSIYDGYPQNAEISNSDETFLLDVNCLIDMGSGRRDLPNLHSMVLDSIKGGGPVYVSTETYTELNRGGIADSVTDNVRKLPAYDPPEYDLDDSSYITLRNLLFKKSDLTVQDESDLRQFLTAYHHRIGNFVTGERVFLRNAQKIKSLFNVLVLAPTEFETLIEVGDFGENYSGLTAGTLNISPLKAISQEAAQREASKVLCSEFTRQTILARFQTNSEWLSQSVMIDGREVAALLISNSANPRNFGTAVVLVDQRGPIDEELLSSLVERTVRHFSKAAPTCFMLLASQHDPTLESVLRQSGFIKKTGHWYRHVAGGPILPKDWGIVADSLNSFGIVEFGAQCPTKTTGKISVAGTKVPLSQVENIIAPSLFLIRSRPGVIVPIQPHWADELLGTGRQANLFAQKSAALRKERTYFKGASQKELFMPGAAICFYESGKGKSGRSAIVAFARCTGARKLRKGEIRNDLYRTAVLDEGLLDDLVEAESVLAVSFDMITEVRRPVPISWLREQGIVGGQNLITSQAISGVTVQKLWKRARS